MKLPSCLRRYVHDIVCFVPDAPIAPANGSSLGCPVFSMVPPQPKSDGRVDFSSAPAETLPADSEHYIALQLSRAEMMGFTHVILAANSRSGNADILVQSHNGTVYGRSSAPSDGDNGLYEDYVVLPVESGATAHAFVVPVGNTHADVTVLLSFHKDGDCVVPFKITGLDKPVSDPSVDLSDNAAPQLADDAPRPLPNTSMPTFATYKQLPGMPEGQAAVAKRLIDGIRQGNDTAQLLENGGLEPAEYRLAEGVLHTLWKAKDVPDPEQYYYD